MAISSKIKIMISSRCRDRFPLENADSKDLSKIRSQLKSEVEAITIFGKPVYEVWINESAVEDATRPAWEHCLAQAKSCDIFISLYNGNAGWTDRHGTTGICHAEFMAAYNSAPGKVFLVSIFEPAVKTAPKEAHDLHFQTYIASLKRFDVRAAADEAALLQGVRKVVADATVKLVQRGVRDASRGSGHVGPALDWSRLSYDDRAAIMRKTASSGLEGAGRPPADGVKTVERSIDGKSLLFVVDAIPDSLSIPAARETVGQPHLFDHLLVKDLEPVDGGPIHLVACHKNATESQAIRMLGFPNATVVTAPFGIYVVDPVQSIQLVLIAQCRDETTTRHGVQRFLEWLDESEQAAELARHAAKRKSVVEVLAAA